MKFVIYCLLVGMVWFAQTAQASTVVDQVLDGYKAKGAGSFDASRGEVLWTMDFPDPKAAGKVRNCSTCHGSNLKAKGKHAKTGKVIDAMAPSVNAERLTDKKFIEKWFKRNCKWVLGRTCTPQEKGDVLTFLKDK